MREGRYENEYHAFRFHMSRVNTIRLAFGGWFGRPQICLSGSSRSFWENYRTESHLLKRSLVIWKNSPFPQIPSQNGGWKETFTEKKCSARIRTELTSRGLYESWGG